MSDHKHSLASLLLDEPTDVDLLSFDAIAGTITDAVLDGALDPIALGLTGSWGSGKTTVLRLIGREISARDQDNGQRSLVVQTDPWRYDPQLGAKESLISEILVALAEEIETAGGAKDDARKLLKGLVARIDWTKAFTIAAKASIALQIPSVNDVLGLLKPPGDDSAEPVNDMTQFREQFSKLLNADGLAHVRNVVVLVDDLDRCLPETVIETLEAIRLFLSVPKMSFVIAADEDRIAEAISSRFGGHPPTPGANTPDAESPSRLYLHKIVQTSVPVPAMSDFDTHVFLAMLQIQSRLDPEAFGTLIGRVAIARRDGKNVDEISELNTADFADELTFAARLKPILHDKTRGNPRRIKRFLNDLAVRLSIASRRGIELEPQRIAKLMILEAYSPDDFKLLLDWLSENTLRPNLAKLESEVGHVAAVSAAVAVPEPVEDKDKTKKPTPEPDETSPSDFQPTAFMRRWARLPPQLAETDVVPYLVLAASFSDDSYLPARGLPEQLKDIATNLLSSSIGDSRLVTDDMIRGLRPEEALAVVRYIGQVVRDQPRQQISGVGGMLRLSRAHPNVAEAAGQAIHSIPPSELSPGTPILFRPTDTEALAALKVVVERSDDDDVKAALAFALGAS